MDEGLHIQYAGGEFDSLLDKQLEDRALDFVVSDLYVPERHPDLVVGDVADEVPRSEVLHSEELAEKALAASGGDPSAAGEMLGTVLANLPTDVASWDARSVRLPYTGSPYAAAAVSLFGAVGGNAKMAELFCERVRNLGTTEAMPESVAASCVTEGLCSRVATPEAGKIIIQAFAGKLSDHMWYRVIESYTDSPAHTASDDAYLAKAVDVMSMLSWLEQSDLIPQPTRDYIRIQRTGMLDIYTDSIFGRGRETMWGGIETEADYARFITSGQIAKYRKLSGGLALAIEMSINSWYLQLPGGPKDVLLAEQVAARQDQILDIFDVSTSEAPTAPSPRLPRYIAETVEVELTRRQTGAGN